jgi:hypothetical protein
MVKNARPISEVSKIRRRNFKIALGVGVPTTCFTIPWHYLDKAYEKLPERDPGKKIVNHLMLYNPKDKDPSANRTGHYRTNEHGHRTTRSYPSEGLEGQYRILVLGGSTTFSSRVKLGETYSDQLQARLSTEFPDEDILVMNAGKIGMATFEMIPYYFDYQQKHGANLTIFHTGKNDATEKIRPENTEAGLVTRVKLKPWPGQSALLSNYWTGPLLRYPSAIYYGRTSEAARIADETKTYIEKTKMTLLLEKATEYPIGFYNRLERMTKQARSNGSKVILFPVPTRTDVADGFSEKWWKIQETAVQKNVVAMEDLAKKQRTGFLKIDPYAIPLNGWFDYCHLEKEGEIVKGNFLAKYIIEEGFIQNWINSGRKTPQPITVPETKLSVPSQTLRAPGPIKAITNDIVVPEFPKHKPKPTEKELTEQSKQQTLERSNPLDRNALLSEPKLSRMSSGIFYLTPQSQEAQEAKTLETITQ